MYKKLALALMVFAAALFFSAESSESARPVKVIVLVGQSNMSGRGQPMTLAATPNPRLVMWNNGWQTAADPLSNPNDPDEGIGPGMTFGLTLLKYDPSVTVGLVQCAVAGTSIDQWFASSPYYQSCIARARATHGQIVGVLFLQGETEATSPTRAGAWQSQFDIVLHNFQRDLGPARFPFMLGQISTLNPTKFPAQQQVRDAQAAEADLYPGKVFLVPSTDLPNDGKHFTVAGYKALGARFASLWRVANHGYGSASFRPSC